MNLILAIDPGNEESAFVVLDVNLKPIKFGKVKNEELIDIVGMESQLNEIVVIEMVACYGMAVGKTVFDTCVWIGKFAERAEHMDASVNYIYRKDEKMNLCHTMRAKDSNIRQALIDRFGVVGKKKSPGFFYGFKKDIWAAMAVGVTYYDLHLKEG